MVTTKEEADHSLPYMVAVALLDGQVLPRQYEVDRINRPDVQQLLQRVHIHPDAELTARFPQQHACRLRVTLEDGSVIVREKSDFAGFVTRPAGWADAERKFRDLGGPAPLAAIVRNLENVEVSELCDALALARGGGSRD
jgi:2-methylcitrate dehydratase